MATRRSTPGKTAHRPAPKRPPIVKPPVLFDETQAALAAAETQLGQPLIVYWISTAGSVTHGSVEALYRLFSHLGRATAWRSSSSPRGAKGPRRCASSTWSGRYTDRLTVLIPLDCASAATMIALGADEIRMGPLAYLSAIDTSLCHDLSPVDPDNDQVSVSQDELMRVVRLWKGVAQTDGINPYQSLFRYVHPLVVGAVDRASSLSIKLCKEILAHHMKNEDDAQRISELLNSNYPAHEYPITLAEARRIGLHVQPLDATTNDLLLALNELYCRMGRRAITDYDQHNHHNNEITAILEAPGIQVFYQLDKDWHYKLEERRWVFTNDRSSWHRVMREDGELKRSEFQIR